MQWGNRRPDPNIRLYPITRGRLEIGAAARNGHTAGSQELSGIVGLHSPDADLRLRDRAVLESEVLLKVAIVGRRTQCVSRTLGIVRREDVDAIAREVSRVVPQEFEPPLVLPKPVFKTGAIGRSATLP